MPRSRVLRLVGALVLCSHAAHAAVRRVPIATHVDLNPGEATTITVDASEATEIGWEAVQPKACTTNCVQATEVDGRNSFSMATPRGASKKYRPTGGKIAIEYKNTSSEPVTINVYRVTRTCDAEACRIVDVEAKGQWLVFKVDEFTSISTSKDGSYSVISGVAVGGRRFTFTAAWWTDENPNGVVNCAPFVQRYVAGHTPPDRYRPYVISGHRVGDTEPIVLRSIDTCAPHATTFGVPEQNVFK